jgi:intein-encoded DNA endonuclease-like protein
MGLKNSSLILHDYILEYAVWVEKEELSDGSFVYNIGLMQDGTDEAVIFHSSNKSDASVFYHNLIGLIKGL